MSLCLDGTSRFPKKSQINLILRLATPCCLCILKDPISFHVSVFILENATIINFTLRLYNQPCWQFCLYCHSCFRSFPCIHSLTGRDQVEGHLTDLVKMELCGNGMVQINIRISQQGNDTPKRVVVIHVNRDFRYKDFQNNGL